jgi:hypothetical protein
LHTTCGRWLVVGALVFAASTATALPVAAQSTGGDASAEAATADQAPADATMDGTDQAQATDAAPAKPAAPKPTVEPVQFGPTGC